MKYIIISGIVILAVFLVILAMIPKGIEPLTEMYFENHTSLPKLAFLDREYNFSFTIRNLEFTTMDYEYIIQAFNESGDLIEELNRGWTTLANNESTSINETFIFDKPFERAKVNVLLNKLTSGNEANAKRRFWWKDENYPDSINIHFWVEEITGPKITFNVS